MAIEEVIVDSGVQYILNVGGSVSRSRFMNNYKWDGERKKGCSFGVRRSGESAKKTGHGRY